jgi:16S rRNA (cytidine1402-2'-O)-methyltransferase
MHEEFLRGTVAEVRGELAARDRIRGEITLLVEAPTPAKSSGDAPGTESASETIAARVGRMQSEAGIDEKEALKRLARELGRSKSDLYRELQRERARKR